MINNIRKIQALELFQGVSSEELSAIEKASEYLHFKKNETLFSEHEPMAHIYIILYGSFKILRKGSQEEPVIFNFLGRNEALGTSVVRLPQPHFPVTAIANEESCVLKIGIADFHQYFLKNPQLESRIHLQLAKRFMDFQEDRCVSRSRAAQKIANFLLRILDRQPESCRQQIMTPLTRHDIARRIGSETETVVRLMSQWTKNGWIKTRSKHVEILNRRALEELG